MALVAYQGLFDQLLLLDFPDFGQTVGRALNEANVALCLDEVRILIFDDPAEH